MTATAAPDTEHPGATPVRAPVVRWRDAVLQVQAAILSGADVDTVLETVAETARTLVDGDVATLGVPRVPGQSLVLRVAVGYRADDLRDAVFPVEQSLSGQVMTTGAGLHVPDATANANAYQPICELGDMGPTLLVPLERRAGPFGTLLVARRRGHPAFDADALELLTLFAGHVSVAVEFCRSQEELRRLASVEESERVGRELHDTVIQRLFALGLRLRALTSDSSGGQVETVLSELDEIVREIRVTVLEDEPRSAPPG